jgi:hypothetical protein
MSSAFWMHAHVTSCVQAAGIALQPAEYVPLEPTPLPSNPPEPGSSSLSSHVSVLGLQAEHGSPLSELASAVSAECTSFSGAASRDAATDAPHPTRTTSVAEAKVRFIT